MRRRSRLHWGAVGREAADQCGEEFTRGGACRGSPSSVESRAQRALCTPAAGTRSQARCTWAWRPQYTPTHKVSKLGRPVHLRTLIATSLWMMIRHPPSGSHRFGKTALQSAQASRRPGLLARTPHCGAKSRQENAPTCWREGRGERERAQSENLLEAGVRPVCSHAHGCRVSVVPGKEASLHLLHGCRWQRLSAGSQVAEESRGLGRVVGTLRSSLTDKYPFPSPGAPACSLLVHVQRRVGPGTPRGRVDVWWMALALGDGVCNLG
ncbi:uncharacterized protein LOC142856268 isoform X1 [Microtus pennsylvanicus]|uniref:uncharacterized protein LOC142856268 isoform X1 n=1 Tax=Microtus pennsylvanicus TaxID=10058 RepID=UPI003F6C149E